MKSSGQVKVWDFDLDRSPRDVASAIGVVPQELNIDPFFTPRELLNLQAGLYGVPRHERRTTEILGPSASPTRRRPMPGRSPAACAGACWSPRPWSHNPPVLVLDEPTAGVDVELRQQLWRYVRELNARGVTVLLTTHYLEEAEQLCDRIAIINHGRVIACDTTAALLRRLDAKELSIIVERDLTGGPRRSRSLRCGAEGSAAAGGALPAQPQPRGPDPDGGP